MLLENNVEQKFSCKKEIQKIFTTKKLKEKEILKYHWKKIAKENLRTSEKSLSIHFL